MSTGDWQHGEAADGAVEDNERRTNSVRLLPVTEGTLSLQTTKSFCWRCLQVAFSLLPLFLTMFEVFHHLNCPAGDYSGVV